MHAEDIAEDFPVVSMDSNALEAARMLAEHRLPGIVVTDPSGKRFAVLPASQVVRFIIPQYVQDDPSLAGVLDESMADRRPTSWPTRPSAMFCPTTSATYPLPARTTPSSKSPRTWHGAGVRSWR